MQEGKPSKTAELVCLFRALEYAWHGESSILKDSMAHNFLQDGFVTTQYRLFNAKRREKAYRKLSFGLYDWIILRHGYLDYLLKQYAAEKNIVLLGAGYDSRAYRLGNLIKHQIYEVDFPATQKSKLALLNKLQVATDYVQYLEADFINQSLEDILASVDRSRPTYFIWEGVTMYITREVIENTMATLAREFGAGSVIAFDYWNTHAPSVLEQQIMKISPKLMELFFSEPLTFSANAENMKEICMANGANKFTSLEAPELVAPLGAAGYAPNKYNSMAVVEF